MTAALLLHKRGIRNKTRKRPVKSKVKLPGIHGPLYLATPVTMVPEGSVISGKKLQMIMVTAESIVSSFSIRMREYKLKFIV
jgi:hypothetical protein